MAGRVPCVAGRACGACVDCADCVACAGRVGGLPVAALLSFALAGPGFLPAEWPSAGPDAALGAEDWLRVGACGPVGGRAGVCACACCRLAGAGVGVDGFSPSSIKMCCSCFNASRRLRSERDFTLSRAIARRASRPISLRYFRNSGNDRVPPGKPGLEGILAPIPGRLGATGVGG